MAASPAVSHSMRPKYFTPLGGGIWAPGGLPPMELMASLINYQVYLYSTSRNTGASA